MTPQEIITIAIQYGLPTVLLFLGARFHVHEKRNWDKEREHLIRVHTDEAHLRIEDAKIGFTTLRDMQSKVTDSVSKLSDVAESRELQRELITAVAKAETIIATIQKLQDPRGGR